MPVYAVQGHSLGLMHVQWLCMRPKTCLALLQAILTALSQLVVLKIQRLPIKTPEELTNRV